jgi:hypothetical protein
MTSPTTLADDRGHPLDECECGDYRRNHKDGTGPCTFNRAGFDMLHAFEDCLSFTLAHAHLETNDE